MGGQTDFGHFLGADSENHTHFFWKSIFSLLPLCTKLAKMPKNRHFCVVLAPAIFGVFLGYIWVSLVKWPPKELLMMSLVSDEIWGLVLVRTGLARILKFDKIEIQHYLCFLLDFRLFYWGCSIEICFKTLFLQDFVIMGLLRLCTGLSTALKLHEFCIKR